MPEAFSRIWRDMGRVQLGKGNIHFVNVLYHKFLVASVVLKSFIVSEQRENLNKRQHKQTMYKNVNCHGSWNFVIIFRFFLESKSELPGILDSGVPRDCQNTLPLTKDPRSKIHTLFPTDFVSGLAFISLQTFTPILRQDSELCLRL